MSGSNGLREVLSMPERNLLAMAEGLEREGRIPQGAAGFHAALCQRIAGEAITRGLTDHEALVWAKEHYPEILKRMAADLEKPDES